MELSKSERQAALLELLGRQALYSQSDICDAMRSQGYEVTQPSISRDLRELGVVKLSGRYLPSKKRSGPLNEAGTLVQSVKPAGPNIVVVSTSAGAAEAVAARIDRVDVEGLVGTVAGDNTIFVAVESLAAQEAVIPELEDLLNVAQDIQ